MQYTQDSDETLPRPWYGKDAGPSSAVNYKWEDAIDPYIESAHVFECPSDGVNKPFRPYIHQFPYPVPNTDYGSYVFNNAYYAAGDQYTPPGGQKLSSFVDGTTTLIMDGERDFQFAWPNANHAPTVDSADPPHLGSITLRHYDAGHTRTAVSLWIDGSAHACPFARIANPKTMHGQKIDTGFTIERDGAP